VTVPVWLRSDKAAMPTVLLELDAVTSYGLVSAAPLATYLVSLAAAGWWADRRGPVPGVHRAEASRAGIDDIGGGVNLAARISAAAAGFEVLASVVTLESSRRRDLPADRRSVKLKGFSEPIDVASIGLR